MNLLGPKKFQSTVFYFAILLLVAISVIVLTTTTQGGAQTAKLSWSFGLMAFSFLYLALLGSSVNRTFPDLSWRSYAALAVRPCIVATLGFAFLHAFITFFLRLGGFAGLSFLDQRFVLAITLGLASLILLAFLALMANRAIQSRLKFKNWDRLSGIAYGIGVLILIHALMLGTHFADLSGTIPEIAFTAVAILVIIEAIYWDRLVSNKYRLTSSFGPLFVVVVAMGSVFYYTYVFNSPTSSGGLSIHAQHLQQAAQNNAAIPGTTGDSSLRFNVALDVPAKIEPNQNTNLSFSITTAGTGDPVTAYMLVHEKLAHLIIVNNELTYFSHIHPDQNQNTFTIITKFPAADQYRLYLDYQPFGATEQRAAFVVKVGDKTPISTPGFTSASELSRQVDSYTVTLQKKSFTANAINAGQQMMTFIIKDSSGKDVTTLQPYLGALGHLVMINTKTFDYIHVHPMPTATTGPNVDFMPLAYYGLVKPGIYRVFVQFNPDNHLITADFTVEVK